MGPVCTKTHLNRAAVSQWTHAPVALPCPHAASSMRTTLLQRFMRPACQSDPLDTLLGSLTIRFGNMSVASDPWLSAGRIRPTNHEDRIRNNDEPRWRRPIPRGQMSDNRNPHHKLNRLFLQYHRRLVA